MTRHYTQAFRLFLLVFMLTGCGPIAKLLSKGAKVAPKAGSGIRQVGKGAGKYVDDATETAGRFGDDVGQGIAPATKYADDVEHQSVRKSAFSDSAFSFSARESTKVSSYSLSRVLAKSKKLGEQLQQLKSKISIDDAIGTLDGLSDAWENLDNVLSSLERQLNDPDVSSDRKDRLETRVRAASKELDRIEGLLIAFE